MIDWVQVGGTFAAIVGLVCFAIVVAVAIAYVIVGASHGD